MADLNKLSFTISGQSTQARNSIKKLITQIDSLGVSFDKVASQGAKFNTMLGQISGATQGIATGMGTINNATKGFSNTVAKNTTKVKTQNTALQKTRTKLAGLTSNTKKNTTAVKKQNLTLGKLVSRITQITFVVQTLRTATRLLMAGTKKAIAYVENLNLFMVALGENTTRATGFIKEMSESLYLDEAQLTRVQGLFYQISESLGLSSEKAYILSENFTKLAYDLASFYNLRVDDAVTKLQAGLVGETEPLRRIGIIITENNLAETARNLGIKKSIRNMTEQEKIQLRYITALQQTQNAQSDLARTMEQPENLIRIAREQFSVLGREIGNSFIPMIKNVVPQVIGLTRALTGLAKKLAELAGYDPPEVSDDLGGYSKVVADQTEESEKASSGFATNLRKALGYTRALSNATTGIDELNIVSDSNSYDLTNMFDTSEVAKSTGAIDEALKEYNNGIDGTNKVFDDITKKWEKRLNAIVKVFNTSFDDSGKALSDLFDTLFGEKTTSGLKSFSDFLSFVDDVITKVATDLTKVVDGAKTIWNDVISPFLQSVAPEWFGSFYSSDMVNIVAKLIELSIAFKAFKVGESVLKMLSSLITLGGKMSFLTGLTTMFALGSGIKIALMINDAKVNGDWESVTTQIMSSIIAGLFVFGLTGSFKAGVLTMSIVTTFEFNPISKIKDVLFDGDGNPVENLINDYKENTPTKPDMPKPEELEGVKGAKKFIEAMDNFGNALAFLATGGIFGRPLPKKFANGGTPQKGSLFIAGEAGAELVGDMGNGGTSVVNKKQAKQLGIPMFANGTNVPKWDKNEQARASNAGVNVPKWTHKEQNTSAGIGTYDSIDNVITIILDAITIAFTDVLPKEATKFLAKLGKDTIKWFGKSKIITSVIDAGKKAFKGVKTAGIYLWEGISNSRAFKGAIDIFGKMKDVLAPVLDSFKVAGKTVVSFYEAFASDAGTQDVMSQGLKNAKGGKGKTSTKGQQNVMKSITSSLLGGGVAGTIFSVMQSVNDGVLGSFVESLPTFIQAGMDMILNLITGVEEALPDILAMIPNVITSMVDLLTNPEMLTTIIESLINMAVQIALALPDIIVSIVEALPDLIMTLIDVIISNVPLFAKAGVVIAVALVDALINTVITGINALLKLINKAIPGKRFDIPLISFKSDMANGVASAMGFANGGYPDQGQMFIAREAGAELVGNIGGRTSVMNNDQIVESVSRGVYTAVSKAMSEQSQKAPVVNLDGKRVNSRLAVANRSTGRSYGMEGF